MIPPKWFLEADKRITDHIQITPLVHDLQNDLYFKLENQQVTGSFKVRGAFNKVLGLQRWEQERGLVAASAGNHGLGVALAASLVSARVTIFVSDHAVPAKVEKMRRLGAEVRLVPGGYAEAEAAGIAWAAADHATWVSPYNDGQVIAGQGTLALEIIRQLHGQGFQGEYLAWVVPVGGGGLAAGICLALAEASGVEPAHHPVFGIQSEASPFFHGLFHLGTQADISELDSLADGLAGPVEQGALTIPILQSRLQNMLLVSEADLRMAIRYAWQEHQWIIEGSAAAALAAVLTGKVSQRPALVILSGGNIQPEVLSHILEAG